MYAEPDETWTATHPYTEGNPAKCFDCEHEIVLNKQGEFGAAGTQANFPYSITTPEFSEVRKGQPLSQATQKEGGNE